MHNKEAFHDFNREIIPKEKLKNRKVFLEIGSGHAPVEEHVIEKFNGDLTYIGVEKNGEKTLKSTSENSFYINADSSDLSFLDNEGVDTVFMANVFGDHKTKDMNLTIKEICRVLKKDGLYITYEDYTPPQQTYVVNLLTRNGLEINKITTTNDPDWNAESTKYHHNSKHFGTEKVPSYIIQAKKPNGPRKK